MYVVDGIQNMKTLMAKTGLTERLIYNVRSRVKAVIDEVVGKKEKKVNPSEVPGGRWDPSEVRWGQEGALVAGDIDTSIYEKKVPADFIYFISFTNFIWHFIWDFPWEETSRGEP